MTSTPAELAAFRPDMLRFACLQLRDEQLAEDVVQEALTGALVSQQEFAGRAAFKTWVFAILKHKIVDALRGRERSINISALAGEADEFEPAFDRLFKENGHWAPGHKPSAWGDPVESLRQQQFWEVFDVCLHHLPANTGRVFMMREFLELDVEEICRELQVSASNCYVILHRARHQLRSCLEKGWFEQGETPC